MTDTQTTQPTFADMFPIPDASKDLARFVGSWTFDGSLTAEGAEMPIAGTWTFAPAAAGWGIVSTLRGRVDPLGAYEEDDLLGFDQETGLFHIYSLTSCGAVHDHVARWTRPGCLEFEYTGLQGGKPYREIGSVEVTGEGTMVVMSEDYVDGALSSRMVARLRKS